jgi:hypothetical protein
MRQNSRIEHLPADVFGERGSTNWTPQANASTAGARPKLMTSARESISRPKSLVVFRHARDASIQPVEKYCRAM